AFTCCFLLPVTSLLFQLFSIIYIFLYSFSGGIAALFMFLVFATLQVPDGIMIRPHRAFWRCIMGFSILYLLLLVFLLFQDLNIVRSGLAVIDPTLGIPLKEKSYAENCGSWAAFKDQVDLFVSAHFFGWLVKALVLRDVSILWFLSLFYEWMEISLRHILPNFWECWWDHLILDVFGCNLLGIFIGLKLGRFLDLKKFDWQVKMEVMAASKPKKSQIQTLKSILSSILTFGFSSLAFPFMKHLRSYFAVVFLCVITTLVDLNIFFLKAELWIDTSHWIVILRTVFWGIVSASGIREFYEYMMDSNCDRMGVQCWLDIAMVLSELLLAIKWSHGLVWYYPCPTWILISWIIIFIVFVVTTFSIWKTSVWKKRCIRMKNA
ncbi:phosphatidyl serine synthase, partial [Cardiosporidium cionae]